MSDLAVLLLSAGSVMVFVGYRLLERAWRWRVLRQAALRILPMAPTNLQPPTLTELGDGPLGGPASMERRPPRR